MQNIDINYTSSKDKDRLHQFGSIIRRYRQQTGETLHFVAKRFNVGKTYLSKLENGHEKPSISFLNSLIRHYSIPEMEAIRLFTLSGYRGSYVALSYKRKEVQNENMKNEENTAQQGPQVNLNSLRAPILYTDSVWLTSNQFGIVFNVAQSVGPTNQQEIVARIGMSRDHAKVLLDVLGKHLAMTTSNSKKQ